MHVNKKDAEKGLYEKYYVTRTDGRSSEGEDHEGCEYFVLDKDCDPYAPMVLVYYAYLCRHKYPQLSSDLMKWAQTYFNDQHRVNGLLVMADHAQVLRRALQMLVATKEHKDKYGKGGEYEAMRKDAWDAARAALEYTKVPPPIPVVFSEVHPVTEYIWTCGKCRGETQLQDLFSGHNKCQHCGEVLITDPSLKKDAQNARQEAKTDP